jgi:hypothetical protein
MPFPEAYRNDVRQAPPVIVEVFENLPASFRNEVGGVAGASAKRG